MTNRKMTISEGNKIRRDILDWATAHGYVIDPGKGMELAVENYFRFGFCPCDASKSRTDCPCPESISDIQETGHCLCRLFWKDYETYKGTLKKEDEDEGSIEDENPEAA